MVREDDFSPYATFGAKDDVSLNFQEGYKTHVNQGGRRFGARGGQKSRGNRRGFEREFVRTPREQERCYGGQEGVGKNS